jgi:hypothetical protein
LFVWKCVLQPGDNTIAVNKYIISYHIISYYYGEIQGLEQYETLDCVLKLVALCFIQV